VAGVCWSWMNKDSYELILVLVYVFIILIIFCIPIFSLC
jgi:hypothetical protein